MGAQFFEVDLPPVSERKVQLVDAVLPDTQKVGRPPLYYHLLNESGRDPPGAQSPCHARALLFVLCRLLLVSPT